MTSGGSVVTQFDKDDVEAAGLVKFDFLGLRTLTVIDRAVAHHQRARAPQRRAPRSTSRALPMDDAADLRAAASPPHHGGVPARIARHEGPDPAPAAGSLRRHRRAGGAVPPRAAAVGHGRTTSSTASTVADARAPIDYLHPRSWSRSLAPTYGVILYQEQVMQIAQVLAGYTLGGADLLRRAMGKKSPRRWRSSARSSSTAPWRAMCRERRRASHLRPDGEVRGLRLQQVALGRVRAALLPDRRT